MFIFRHISHIVLHKNWLCCPTFVCFGSGHRSHYKLHTQQQLIYLTFSIYFRVLLCFAFSSQVFHQVSGLPWQQIGMSCRHFTPVLAHVNDNFTAIPIPDFTERFSAAVGSESESRCVCVFGGCGAGWLTLRDCPCAGFGEREEWIQMHWSRYPLSQPHMASATAAVGWNRRGLGVRASRCPLTQTATLLCTATGIQLKMTSPGNCEKKHQKLGQKNSC